MDFLPPTKPDESDCCGSGCRRCVFDVYEEEYKIWERRIEGNEENGVGGTEEATLCPDKYTDLRIQKMDRVNTNTFVYHLSEQSGKQIQFKMDIGQHVIIKSNFGEEYITRPFTPVQMTEFDKNLTLVIKLYKNGKMSSVVSDWKVGDLVRCRGPVGSQIQYSCNKWGKILLIAAGTGITPMAKVIQTILCNDDEDTVIILLYACQVYEDILLKEQLDKWAEYWNFHVIYFLSQEDKKQVESKKKYNENIFYERISFNSLKSIGEQFHINFDDAKLYSFVCGPIEFEIDLEKNLVNCGMTIENIYRF
uniref:NADH-cytochrome b5 reductase-like isoform X1 n=1 Tax=Styela clava TaxID=7725 RepID=UPI00193A47F7|nr:NADH-cytochrome b5 reductase-like isoform X1 [Styela clava]